MGKKIEKKFLLLSVLSVIWLWNCSGSSGNSGASTYIEKFRKTVLNEINLVRQKPNTYITERLGANLKDYIQCTSGAVDNGLAIKLGGTAPTTPLVFDDKLNQSAQKYAQFLQQNNKDGIDWEGGPDSRCRAEGYSQGCKENVVVRVKSSKNKTAKENPEIAAQDLVLELLLDCRQLNEPNRTNILNTGHKKLGVGYAEGTAQGQFTFRHVQDFGTQ